MLDESKVPHVNVEWTTKTTNGLRYFELRIGDVQYESNRLLFSFGLRLDFAGKKYCVENAHLEFVQVEHLDL